MDLSKDELMICFKSIRTAIDERGSSGTMMDRKELANKLAAELGEPPVFSPKGNWLYHINSHPTKEEIQQSIQWADEDD